MPKIKKKTIEVFEVDGKDFVSADEAKKHFLYCIVQEWADRHSVGRGGEWCQQWIVNEILETFPFKEYLEAQKADQQTKRFFLFAWEQHEACGGFGDFSGSFDTKEEASSAGRARPYGYEWQVVDSYTGDTVVATKD